MVDEPRDQRLLYESSAKHSRPWVVGVKGSQCPREISLEAAQAMLGASEVAVNSPKKRYATDGQRAYCAMEHEPGRWHGWPVGWYEVPEALWRKWQQEGRVRHSDINRHWRG